MQVYAHRGIAPRAMHRIFQEKETKPEAGIRVQMSYVEVYNEVCNSFEQQIQLLPVAWIVCRNVQWGAWEFE